VSQGCYKGVTRVLQGCYKGVTRVSQGYYKVVARVLQGCSKVVPAALAAFEWTRLVGRQGVRELERRGRIMRPRGENGGAVQDTQA
jgi:hypothetical protein